MGPASRCRLHDMPPRSLQGPGLSHRRSPRPRRLSSEGRRQGRQFICRGPTCLTGERSLERQEAPPAHAGAAADALHAFAHGRLRRQVAALGAALPPPPPLPPLRAEVRAAQPRPVHSCCRGESPKSVQEAPAAAAPGEPMDLNTAIQVRRQSGARRLQPQRWWQRQHWRGVYAARRTLHSPTSCTA